jgi:DNA polymerase I-like protein with 3'-5' exonuclease and polymerase domains
MHVETVRQMVEAEMTRAPEWAAGLPLACEIGIAQNYGDAK